MRGEVGRIVRKAGQGDKSSMELVNGVFGPAFHTPAGWTYILGKLDGGTVSTQLKIGADFWSLETFQALYVGSWIHNPVEKGTFMISLPGNAAQTVQAACKRLLKEKEMSRPREFSHE